MHKRHQNHPTNTANPQVNGFHFPQHRSQTRQQRKPQTALLFQPGREWDPSLRTPYRGSAQGAPGVH